MLLPHPIKILLLLFGFYIFVLAGPIVPQKNGIIPILRLDSAEITVALEILSAYSGKDIAPSSTVAGKVSVHFRNISWMAALDSVCKMKRLFHKKENGYIGIYPMRDIKTEELPKTNYLEELKRQPLVRKRIRGRYAASSKLLTSLRPFLTPSGSLAIDEKTQEVVVADSAGNIDKLLRAATVVDTSPNIYLHALMVKNDSIRTKAFSLKKLNILDPLTAIGRCTLSIITDNYWSDRKPAHFAYKFVSLEEGKLPSDFFLKDYRYIMQSIKRDLKDGDKTEVSFHHHVPIGVMDHKGEFERKEIKAGMKIYVYSHYLNRDTILAEVIVEKKLFKVDPTIGLFEKYVIDTIPVPLLSNACLLISGFSNPQMPIGNKPKTGHVPRKIKAAFTEKGNNKFDGKINEYYILLHARVNN